MGGASLILGGGQSGYSNFFWKNLVTGRHLEILGGGELKKPPCMSIKLQ